MKDRSELPHIYFKFYNEIFVQFGERIKILRSDNALEFTQSVMDSFCVDHGILHHTSCPHTSPQNGVAERKHRHVRCCSYFTLQYACPSSFLACCYS